MTATLENLLTYSDVLVRMRAGFLRASEIPVEHLVSLPMPTRRTSEPGFAFFACPTSSRFVTPLQHGPPDRWWVMGAANGKLEIYALARVVPLATNVSLARITMPEEARSLAQIREDADSIERQMNALAPRFFAGEPGESAERGALLQALTAHLKEPMLPAYTAVAPDFFAWLRA
jgi:hypothetical protein